MTFLQIDPYRNLFEIDTARRLGKALSPRFVLDRIALWLYCRRHPEHPWITQAANRLLQGFVKASHAGFEWGSGNGSVWLARHSRTLTSVEHDAAWGDVVRRRLEQHGLRNVDYRLVSEQRYTDAIDEFPDRCFDYVLVDGLFRDVAFLKSIPKVKPGGWIVLDNVNWYLPSQSRTPHSRTRDDGPASELWRRVQTRIRDWRTIWTTNGVNDTAIFVKPIQARYDTGWRTRSSASFSSSTTPMRVPTRLRHQLAGSNSE